MWTVRHPTIDLPPGFMMLEELHFLTVRCDWCLNEKVYRDIHVSPDSIQADALVHRIECHTPRPERS